MNIYECNQAICSSSVQYVTCPSITLCVVTEGQKVLHTNSANISIDFQNEFSCNRIDFCKESFQLQKRL